MPRPRPTASESALGPAFAGVPAATGARLAAFTIDVVLVALLAGGVLWATRSPTLAVVVALQVAVGLAVALARTGATPGNLLLRLRAARSDGPFSPGAGRAFVRALITGAGFVVGVGSWIVVASSAWDPLGRRRSWADRAADTVVVAAPRRGGASAPAAVGGGATLAPPQLISMSARPAVDEEEDDEPAPLRAAPSGVPAAPAPVVSSPAMSSPAVSAPVAATPAASPDPARGALLLVFDTGQRVRIDLPAAVTLGRRPAPTEPGDVLVVIDDPDSTVSKSHLRLEHSRGRTWVTDLGSTNGSDILADQGGRTELPAGTRLVLDDGDRVRVGDRVFTINLLMPEAEGAADQPLRGARRGRAADRERGAQP
ncbi:RDD family protein [Microbacterium resistens]|uniref:RDD family protein n=1 Tax=Microbacterium resistens TaxID=156977 RepID=A0ABY3RQX1_9MICO|nr:RDD family protein [Microbacterium resistens]UGS25291.1 RDD family protein [Microbacterium resistens]